MVIYITKKGSKYCCTHYSQHKESEFLLHNEYGSAYSTKRGKSYWYNGSTHNLLGPAYVGSVINGFEYWIHGISYNYDEWVNETKTYKKRF